jgi:calcineurin-like phosphoesterase family protein
VANINKGISMIWFSGDKHFFHDFMLWGKKQCVQCAKPLRRQDVHADGQSLCCAAVVKQMEPPPRPGFTDIWHMNKTIVANHNEVVAKGDLVYELGDLGLKCTPQALRDIRYEMNGQFYFVNGNHDQVAEQIPDAFVWMKDLVRVSPKGWQVPPIVLCHYAMRVWHGSHKGTWQLYGHSHGNLPEEAQWLSFDVGVDANNFYPVSIEDVIKRMQPKVEAWKEWKAKLKKPGGVGW